jgi:ribosomal protein S18 acetylase RimI-like enzyme
MVRRLSGSVVEERADYVVVRTPASPTFWWGNFLLMPAPPALDDAERWESWFVAEFSDLSHRAFGIDASDGKTGDPATLAALGANTQVNAVMSATALREPAAPNLELRTLNDADWSQLAALRSAVYPTSETADGDAEAAFVAGQVAANRGLVARSHAAWLGAFDDGLLVASLGIIDVGSGVARYQSVETHPNYRRRGLARRLLYDAAVLAGERFDAGELVIVADPEDHAFRLYESLGFATVELQVELSRTA